MNMSNNRLHTAIPLLSLMLMVAPGAGHAQDRQNGGQVVFRQHCSHCHAPGLNHPGTLQLSVTRGEANAVLEERDNLPGSYVKTIVRQGLNAMPGFKPTIVTETELEALVDYLSD